MILKKVYFSTFLRFVVSVTLVSFAQTGGLLLEGDSIKYFGATIPINLAAAVIAEDLDRLYPGGAFDPLGLANDPE